TVEDHGNEGTDNAGGEQHGVALGLAYVTENHADDERASDRNRESNGESSHVDCSNQQKVGEVEDGSADHHGDDAVAVGRPHIVQETGSIIARAPHRESEMSEIRKMPMA